MFKRDPSFSEAMASLTPGRRTAFILLSIGGILPILFIGHIRPIYWVVAFQMAGLSYLRWRSLAFGGSVWIMVVMGLACVVSVATAAMI